MDLLFILESFEHVNASTKSAEFESGPMIRYLAGEWGFVKTWLSKDSFDIFSHQVWKTMIILYALHCRFRNLYLTHFKLYIDLILRKIPEQNLWKRADNLCIFEVLEVLVLLFLAFFVSENFYRLYNLLLILRCQQRFLLACWFHLTSNVRWKKLKKTKTLKNKQKYGDLWRN